MTLQIQSHIRLLITRAFLLFCVCFEDAKSLAEGRICTPRRSRALAIPRVNVGSNVPSGRFERRLQSRLTVAEGSRRVGGRRNGGRIRQRLYPANSGHDRHEPTFC
jgi:hypothetical protein